jgi:cysteine desulfuration protein SufE
MLPDFDEIKSNFELLEDGDEQFEYLMELGRMMPALPPEKHTEDRLVPGCQSRVWLDMEVEGRGPQALMRLNADSDAHITKGLVAFLVALYSGQSAASISGTDAVRGLQGARPRPARDEQALERAPLHGGARSRRGRTRRGRLSVSFRGPPEAGTRPEGARRGRANPRPGERLVTPKG